MNSHCFFVEGSYKAPGEIVEKVKDDLSLVAPCIPSVDQVYQRLVGERKTEKLKISGPEKVDEKVRKSIFALWSTSQLAPKLNA